MISLRSYRAVVAASAVLVFFTNLANYTLIAGVEPLYWIAGFLALAVPLVVGTWATTRIRVDPLVLWSFGFVVLSMLWFFHSSQSVLAWQQVQTRVLSVTFLLLMMLLFVDAHARYAARWAVVTATLLTAGLHVYELFNPMTFSDIPGRSTALFANVNQSGSAVVIGLILGQGVIPPPYRTGFVLATGIGVLPTFSRAAMLGWLLVVVITWVRTGLRLRNLLGLGGLALTSFAFFISPWWGTIQRTLTERGVLTENVRDRLAFFEQGGTTGDASAVERVDVARLAWRTFADSPVVGRGTGAATETIFQLGPHNMYLSLMVDHGILGLFILPLLLLAVLWGINRSSAPVAIPFVLFIAFWGFFSHNVLEERQILLGVALVATMVAAGRERQRNGQDRPQ